MKKAITKRQRIHLRVRKVVNGTADRPRLAVFRSNKEIYAQIIDDVNGKTLATAASLKLGFEGNKTDVAKQVGMKLAEVAKGKGIETVSFDRGGFLYHGRVKALAEGAREGGLKF
ncbi:MAG: 50S ribosomal protein L18 [Schleiferiaceae bacterium]|jgi:large subunit ribosomal protein L18|nr:50S ribosomal protein L18 [Flavobacteriales bacterium]MDA9256012.1 50S ribosomal protein L18 [Schleiferiaceae bacterium]NCF95154.1 50S ribosomal protein L18 [Bacteroidota bacterium]MBT3571925.1 50S ribosomal protein L18 [Flavobacteriales bacterium]MBT3678483.1 50S ribosomal protein L18 [Flavobacteriales bacterium]|tara:strand:+ start:15823 stop:16167 length:345 start_codon:yes stop_codon:yes gene_type:complete